MCSEINSSHFIDKLPKYRFAKRELKFTIGKLRSYQAAIIKIYIPALNTAIACELTWLHEVTKDMAQ